MKRVHLIGIGGTGLSAIARVLLELGYVVSGSDCQESPFTRDLAAAGATIAIGHRMENLGQAEAVVRSSAIPDDNPEVVAARSAGIPVLKRAEFLGELMTGRTGIAVAGTHGKTTTTAMIAWMLSDLKVDPTFIIGGVLTNLGVNARAGEGDFFVIEADEYDHMFLGLKPVIEVVTNIEHDHPDCYPTPADFHAAFLEFVRRLPEDGILIACADDPGACTLLAEAHDLGKNLLAYGLRPKAKDCPQKLDTYATMLLSNDQGGFTFSANVIGKSAVVDLQVPGLHNVRNALAALTVAGLLGLPLEEAARALGAFQGTGRRFEIRGEVGGVTVVDDYAHHPTEIQATLSAARARYPGRRLWVVWQPHTYSRTQTLFDEFVTAFGDADQVIVTEIYAAREAKQDFSSRSAAEAIQGPPVQFIPDLRAVSNYLNDHLHPGDVLLVLSAGDADQVSTQVLDQLKGK
ncbi:MAG: UDP-N-acetylmuramate--L-alanine ligase [Anaerolineales bacterium]|nr:UDP-N-acetylmuramate--L-alanine ligase [Anaerolineales bacterium]